MFDLKIHILIVDDMMMMRTIVRNALKEIGFFKVTEATDGNNAWEILEKSNPPIQLVISDWNMPNSSGLDLLKKIRTSAQFKGTPFIMFTAEADQQEVATALALGANNYVIKPFTTETLKDKIEAVHEALVNTHPESLR